MGTTVLLLHAFPVGPEMWEPQLEALAAYRVSAPSLVGRGDSIDSWVAQLLAETDDDLVLVGASMGGYCALAVAKRAPERVRGVLLSGSRASADPPDGRVWRDRSIALLREKGTLALWETMRDYAIGTSPDPAISKRLADAIAAHPVEGVVQEVIAMIGREDTTDVVGSLACPFLAVAGELDGGVIAESKKLAGLAPDGELVIIPGANHLVNLQRPDLFNPILLGFLERCIG